MKLILVLFSFQELSPKTTEMERKNKKVYQDFAGISFFVSLTLTKSFFFKYI